MTTIDLDAQLAASGDINAFEKIYRRYHYRVYGLCLRMTRSVPDAEDLAQEVFVQLYRKIDTFRGEASFSTWLHRLTVNHVLMHFRKRVVRMEHVSDDGELEVAPPKGTHNRTQNSIINTIALEEAIKQLPPGYRAVLILHDLNGYEHEQIAEMLGCAIGTSKSQLHKARMKVRLLLKMGATPGKVRKTRLRSLSLKLQPQTA